MPLHLTPLDDDSVPAAVRKAVLPAVPLALRLVAARGLAPLSPPELAVALYQLSYDDDQGIRETADRTARELPDPVLQGALGAPLDPRVLDWFARRVLHRPAPVGLLLANLHTADETFATMASLGGVNLTDQIAQNELRLLRHSPIITALYLNPRTRVSTAMRAVELAVRNGIDVQGIPSFEDVKAAIEQDGAPPPEADPVFAAAMALGAETVVAQGPLDEQTAQEQAEAAERLAEELAQREAQLSGAQDVSRLPLAAKLRLAAIGNAVARAQLVRDSNKVIALAAVRSPALTEQEAERYAGNRSLHEEVIRYLATQRAFTKRYSVKLNLVNNPKCPIALGIGFLGHLTAKDLKRLSRSKSIPSALTRVAQGLVSKREQR